MLVSEGFFYSFTLLKCLLLKRHVVFKIYSCSQINIFSLCIKNDSPFHFSCLLLFYKEKKEEIWHSPMTKAFILSENESQETTKRRHQNFDYTTIANRLSKVIWSNYCHPIGVLKPVKDVQCISKIYRYILFMYPKSMYTAFCCI